MKEVATAVIAILEVQPGPHWILEEGKYHAWVYSEDVWVRSEDRHIKGPQLQRLLQDIDKLVCQICGKVASAGERVEIMFLPDEPYAGKPLVTHLKCLAEPPQRKPG